MKQQEPIVPTTDRGRVIPQYYNTLPANMRTASNTAVNKLVADLDKKYGVIVKLGAKW